MERAPRRPGWTGQAETMDATVCDTSTRPYDVARRCAPISRSWRGEVYGKPLVYLDNGASAQKPTRRDRPHGARPMRARLRQRPSRPALSRQCGDRGLRGRRARAVRAFLNAGSTDEIIFTRSATEAINLVADLARARRISARATRSCSRSWSTTPTSCPGISTASARGAVIKWAPVDDDGNFRPRGVREAARRRAPRSSPSPTCRTSSAP